MSKEVTLPENKSLMSLIDQKYLEGVESALALNDLSKMSLQHRVAYYNAVCTSVGLNPLTQPFAYIVLDGKLTLYARKEASEQLRKINTISTQILRKEIMGDFYEVDVRVKDITGRIEEETAVLFLKDKYGKPLDGVALANAKMKCVTKAKRRATLAISGLGLLDESEIDAINNVTLTENPQVENPFKSDEIKDVTPQADDIPEVLKDEDLGDFVCKVGKKHTGKKLSDFDIFELNGFVESTKKWFSEQGKNPSNDWNEFFAKAEEYLNSREYQGEQSESNEPEGV